MRRERDPENKWLWAVALTPDELTKDRAAQVAGIQQDEGMAPERFTCDECPLVRRCSLAFDSYNTDGDCLYEK